MIKNDLQTNREKIYNNIFLMDYSYIKDNHYEQIPT